MNKEHLIQYILDSKEIYLSVPLDNGKDFPNHDFISKTLNDWVYNPETKSLDLYHNPDLAYEI